MSDASPRRIRLQFYRRASGGGGESVREWPKVLGEVDRHAIGRDLMRAQWRWPVGMPLCRPLGQGLWEIRVQLPCDRIARVFVCQAEGVLVALHGFIKKAQ
jgi:phage-related protein